MKKEEYLLGMDTELFKTYEEENFDYLEKLLIIDTCFEQNGMISFKFAPKKFYTTNHNGEEKIYLGSKDKCMMPCVSSTENNIERVRNILREQKESHLEYIDKEIVFDIFRKNSLKILLPSILLAITTFIITNSPLLLIGLIIGGNALNVSFCRKDYKENDVVKVVIPSVKFENEYKKWQDKENKKSIDYEEKYKEFKSSLPSAKVKSKVLKKVRKHYIDNNL